MKQFRNFLSPLLLLFFFLATGVCAREKVERNLLGGYSQVKDIDDEQIHAAVALAVKDLRVGATAASYSFVPALPLALNDGDVRIVRAFSQVVAGMNYRLILAIVPASNQEYEKDACIGAFAVTIYNHFGEMSVTQWGQEIDCTRAMAALQPENSNDLKNPLGKEFNG